MPGRSKSRSSGAPAGTRRSPSTRPPRFDAHLHLSEYWPNLAANSYDRSIDFSVRGLLAELDGMGVEHGLLLALNDAPTVAATLAEGARLLGESDGRLLRTSTVDPTRGVEAVRAAVDAWRPLTNLSGLKLYPGYQHFYPHDPRLAPLYEFAASRRLPVLFHQGDTLVAEGLVKYARPIEVDEVAVRYREIPFVLCHLGNPWFEEAGELVYKNPNVYTDTSGLLWSPRLPQFDRLVRRAQVRLLHTIDEVGDTSKFLYGSDWPLESIELAVRFVDELPLDEADRDGILGGNARQLFGLGRSGSGSSRPRAA